VIRRVAKSRKYKGCGISLYLRLCNCLISVGKIKVREYEIFEKHYLGANHAVIFVFIIIKLKIIKKEMKIFPLIFLDMSKQAFNIIKNIFVAASP
jgi:hypothetical protein